MPQDIKNSKICKSSYFRWICNECNKLSMTVYISENNPRKDDYIWYCNHCDNAQQSYFNKETIEEMRKENFKRLEIIKAKKFCRKECKNITDMTVEDGPGSRWIIYECVECDQRYDHWEI